MFLHKTEKARAELRPGNRSLSQRERSLLLLADGTRTLEECEALFNGEGGAIVHKLLREGYLERQVLSSGHQAAQAPLIDAQPSTPEPINVVAAPVVQPTPSAPAASAVASDLNDLRKREAYPSPETTQAIKAAADPFDGKRSMATTRMFLFDICERMFARRNPKLAEEFREVLRQAKDRESMLAAAHLMIDEIEKVAGADRADSISERIAMLMPDNLSSQPAP
jgi:hypothetical protein